MWYLVWQFSVHAVMFSSVQNKALLDWGDSDGHSHQEMKH